MSSLGQIGPVVLEKTIFKFRQYTGKFALNLVFFTQRCFVPSWVNLALWFWRRIKTKMHFCFSKLSPLGKGGPFIWSPKDALWQVMLKLAQWFWRRIFFYFVNVFLLFRNYLPLKKGGALHLNKLESLSHKDALCQVWLKLAKWFWRRRWKCEKFTPTTTTTPMTTTTSNKWQILIRKAHLSLMLRWAKNPVK